MQHFRLESHAPETSYTCHPRFLNHFSCYSVFVSPGWRIPTHSEHSTRFRYFSGEFKAPKHRVRPNWAFRFLKSTEWPPWTMQTNTSTNGSHWDLIFMSFLLLGKLRKLGDGQLSQTLSTAIGRGCAFTSLRTSILTFMSFLLLGKLGTRQLSQTLSSSLGRRCASTSLGKLFSHLCLSWY
jgi:hypothetical protein